jgi:hypothetical protein
MPTALGTLPATQQLSCQVDLARFLLRSSFRAILSSRYLGTGLAFGCCKATVKLQRGLNSASEALWNRPRRAERTPKRKRHTHEIPWFTAVGLLSGLDREP